MTDKNKSPDEGPRFEETFDFDEPPALIDVNAFARAGEIIAETVMSVAFAFQADVAQLFKL
jgi:hypothetical protein